MFYNIIKYTNIMEKRKLENSIFRMNKNFHGTLHVLCKYIRKYGVLNVVLWTSRDNFQYHLWGIKYTHDIL